MGLFDSLGGGLKDVFGQVGAASERELISAVLAKTNLGSLSGIVAQLQQGGLNDQVRSWLGNSANMPITADQLRAALSSEQVQQIAQHLGLPVDAALKALAAHLPAAVDQASPNGQLPAT